MAQGLHLSALKADGTIWVGGYNGYGELGNNTVSNTSSIATVLGNHSFVLNGGGYFCSFAIKANGDVWAWGSNLYGQYGNNTTTSVLSPILVISGSNHSFTKLGGTTRNTGGLKSNGEIWTWGSNTWPYILGDNTTTNRLTPVQVVGGHSFIDVHMGVPGGHGLKSNGEIWGWGASDFTSFGWVGDGTFARRLSPVLVIGNHSFVKLGGAATTGASTGGLKSDGSLWMWGRNEQGGLGNNSITHKTSPTLVVGNHSFIDFSTGILHGMGLKSDGTVWTWGHNLYGQLGDNTGTNKSSPVLVAGNHSFIKMTSGYYNSYAMKSDGSIWAWGLGSNGANLNNTNLTNYSSPIQIAGNHSFIDFYTTSGAPPPTFNTKINIGDNWKSINSISSLSINIGDTWKTVSAMYINVGDVWKSVT
jgi:hypothetical protein